MPPRRVSVVVSNYNYGHFLDACLDSVASQTCPPHEVIVVDDGSTDGSEAVLRQWEGRVTIVRQENGGQAAAMQRGFAQSSGEAILFLDADDLLKPTAIETLQLVWSPELAALSFGLDLIDAEGTVKGFYEERPASGDLRPLLLADAGFRFMPTSGNLFRRDVADRLFPLPQGRWKISADAALIRAAAWVGEVRVLPVALGCYRSHAANNYFRDAAAPLWIWRRGLQDMADLARLFCDHAQSGRFGAADLTAARELRLAEIKARMLGAAYHDNGTAPRRAMRAALLREMRHPFSPGALRWGGFLATLLAAPRQGEARLYRPTRPRWLDAARGMLLGPTVDEARRQAKAPRVVPQARLDANLVQSESGALLSTHDWRPRLEHGGAYLCGSEGAIYLRPPFSRTPLRLRLGLMPAEGWAGVPIEVQLLEDGQVQSTLRLDAAKVMEHVLAADRSFPDEVIELRLHARPEPASWRNWPRPAAMLLLETVTLEQLPPECTGVFIEAGVPTAFADVAAGCVADGTLETGRDGTPLLSGEIATLRLRVAAQGRRQQLRLTFSDMQPAGWLLARSGGVLIFDGAVNPGADVVMSVEVPPSAFVETMDITLSFAPRDEHEAPLIAPAILTVVPVPPMRKAPDAEDVVLVPGQQVDPTVPTPASSVFADGWRLDPLDGAVMAAATARIAFRAAAAISDGARVILDMTPRFSPDLRPDDALVVAIGIAGGALERFNLKGEHRLELALPPRARGGMIEILLHTAQFDARDRATPRADALSVTMLMLAPAGPRPLARPAGRSAGPRSLHRLVEAAADAAAATDRGTCGHDAFAAKHAALAAAFSRLAPRALAPAITHGDMLMSLATTGAAARRLGMKPASPRPAAAGWKGDEGLRRFVLDMLGEPADTIADAWGLPNIPVLAAALPAGVAAWLTAAPPPAATEAETARFLRHAAALLGSSTDMLRSRQAGTRGFDLAEAVIRSFDPHSPGGTAAEWHPVSVALADARRTLLQMRGSSIAWAPGRRWDGGSIRLGLLRRGSCITGWVRDIVDGIDRGRVDVVDFPLDHSSAATVLATTVDLSATSMCESVAAIRMQDLDALLLVGSGDADLEDIAAHRLAPLQIATTAFRARTTGLFSVDYMITDRPDLVQEDFTERLMRVDKPSVFGDWIMKAVACRAGSIHEEAAA